MNEAVKQIQNFIDTQDDDPIAVAQRGEAVVEIVLSRLAVLQEDTGMTEFMLGGLIGRLRQDHVWQRFHGVMDYWTFGTFCEEKLHMSLQKAMGLLRVWSRSQKVGMTAEEVERLGWYVADRILQHAKNRADVDRLVELFGRYATKKEFVDALTAEYQSSGGTTPVYKERVIYRYDPTQKQFVDETLERVALVAGKELNKNMFPEEALIIALTQWRYDHAGE